MDRRYQVFISSTFIDLQDARQEVSQALLKSNCFPAGMELFPAADEEQHNFIKQIIDESDYYIVISAGRYGSIHPETGISYTEMEYDYAVETGKPVIRLLHRDPFRQLKGEHIEDTDDGKEKLRLFRSKMSGGTMVDMWDDSNQLGQKVVFGLMDVQQRRPAIGWVRGDQADAEADLKIAKLEKRIAELELEVVTTKSTVFDPAKAFLSIEEIGCVPGKKNIPLRDTCFLVLHSAYAIRNARDVVEISMQKYNSNFRPFSLKTDDVDWIRWCLHKLEATGLVELVTGDANDVIILPTATRMWLAGKVPFDDQKNYTILEVEG